MDPLEHNEQLNNNQYLISILPKILVDMKKDQIDFLTLSKRFKSTVLQSKKYQSFNCGNHHPRLMQTKDKILEIKET